MELFASSKPYLCPIAAFLDPELYYTTHILPAASDEDPNTSATRWAASAANPANRLAWAPAHVPIIWRIDGCTNFGTQFFAVLLAGQDRSDAEPSIRRISVHVPDQSRHPLALRQSLQTAEAAVHGPVLSGNAIATSTAMKRLPIAQYVAQALSAWSQRVPIAAYYARLPFGVRIVIERLTPNVLDTRPRLLDIPVSSGASLGSANVVPTVASKLLSVDELRTLWPDLEHLPPVIHLDALCMQQQLHSSVALVTERVRDSNDKAGCSGTPARVWAFKSCISAPRYFYHELKMLLQLARMQSLPHPNVLPAPNFLVIVDSQLAMESPLVLGMLGTYYELGHLGSVLEHADSNSGIPWEIKRTWAMQLTSALDWLRGTPVRYYSELKPDNIVCVAPDTIRLIDLAQHGNWETFTAPEIYHVENLVRLARCRDDLVPAAARMRYAAMAEEHGISGAHIHMRPEQKYDNPAQGYFEEWNVLSASGQEAAMVYSLGKVLWCIFEGWSHTVNSPAEEYTVDSEWEFPEMRRGSARIQALVKGCTQGSPEWCRQSLDAGPSPGPDDLVRVGTKLYPRGQAGNCSTTDTVLALETLRYSKELWIKKLAGMETFLAAKLRWARKEAADGDDVILGFPLRPALSAVLARLSQI